MIHITLHFLVPVLPTLLYFRHPELVGLNSWLPLLASGKAVDDWSEILEQYLSKPLSRNTRAK